MCLSSPIRLWCSVVLKCIFLSASRSKCPCPLLMVVMSLIRRTLSNRCRGTPSVRPSMFSSVSNRPMSKSGQWVTKNMTCRRIWSRLWCLSTLLVPVAKVRQLKKNVLTVVRRASRDPRLSTPMHSLGSVQPWLISPIQPFRFPSLAIFTVPLECAVCSKSLPTCETSVVV